jgi:serine/threonine protein kinase
MLRTSGAKLGPYEIQSPLGAGGMGDVYCARDSAATSRLKVGVHYFPVTLGAPDVWSLISTCERKGKYRRPLGSHGQCSSGRTFFP